MKTSIYQEFEYLKSTFDSIFDEIIILDTNYTIIDVNKTFCEKYGISKAEAIGNKCYKLTHGLNMPCKKPECKCPVEDVLISGKFSESTHLHYIDEEESYIELLAYPIKANDGTIKNIVKIGRDVTERRKIGNEIKESEEKMNFILSNVNDSVVVISKDHKILYMNKKAEEEFGICESGNNCYKTLMNRDKICDHCSFNKLLTNYDENFRFVSEFTHPSTNQIKYFEYNCTPILNFNGQPALIDIIRDITDRKRNEQNLRNSEEKYRNLVENFPYSILLLDFNKKIFDCNSLTEFYLNKRREELIGKDFSKIFHLSKDQFNNINEIIQNAFNYDVSEITEFKFINNNSGNTSWVEVFFSSVEIRGNKYIQIILHDITEKKLAEDIIKEENKRLKEINEIKKELMKQASEKLKTPLNNISDLTEIFLKSYKDQIDNNAIKLLELIKNGGEKSIDMVGRILDISRIESQEFKLEKQTESLIEIIRDSVDEVMVMVIPQQKQDFFINFDVLEDLYSVVDKIRIKQVVKNLLLKALKNNSSNDRITISIRKNKNDAEILISFAYTGLMKKNIENELSFLKEIVELHKGQVIVTSGKNKLKIFIQLPIKNWKDSLIHIYIIYKSGIPLYDYSFVKKINNSDPSLISGGIVGMITILKHIIQGKKQIKTIDHGDRKLMFETNESGDIIFVLIVKEDLTVFRKKLCTLIEKFDKNYKDLIKRIETTSIITNKWKGLEVSTKNIFCV